MFEFSYPYFQARTGGACGVTCRGLMGFMTYTIFPSPPLCCAIAPPSRGGDVFSRFCGVLLSSVAGRLTRPLFLCLVFPPCFPTLCWPSFAHMESSLHLVRWGRIGIYVYLMVRTWHGTHRQCRGINIESGVPPPRLVVMFRISVVCPPHVACKGQRRSRV